MKEKIWLQEIPIVLPRSHKNREISSVNRVQSQERSTVNPNMVIPAPLFSRYVTATNPRRIESDFYVIKPTSRMGFK